MGRCTANGQGATSCSCNVCRIPGTALEPEPLQAWPDWPGTSLQGCWGRPGPTAPRQGRHPWIRAPTAPLAHAPKGPNLAQAKPQTLGHASGKPRKHACSTPNHKKTSEICLKNTNISHFFQGGHKSSKLQGLIYAPGFTGTVPRWIQGVPSCCPAVPSFGSKLHRHGSKRVVHTIFLFQGALEN